MPAQRIALAALTVALAALGLWILRDFIDALVWAGVLGIATWPLYLRFAAAASGYRYHEMLTPLAFTVLVGLLFCVPLGFALAALGREAFVMAGSLPELEKSGLPVPDWVDGLPFVGTYVHEWWQANLSTPEGARALLGRVNRNGMALEWARQVAPQVLRRSAEFAFTLLTLFFVYRDGARLLREAALVADHLFGPTGRRLGAHMMLAIRGTVNGLVLVGVGEGIVMAIAYWATGVPHAAILGALTGVFASIPFGAPLVFAIAALILIAEAHLAAAIMVLAIGSVVFFIADHFIRPGLIGGATRLPFLWVLLGILGGLASFGLVGLFLGPAIFAALVTLWRDGVAANQ